MNQQGSAALPSATAPKVTRIEGKNWKAEAATKARSLKAEAIKAFGEVPCGACFGTGVALHKRNAQGVCGRANGEGYIFPLCEVCYGDRVMPDYGIEDLAQALLGLLQDGHRPILPDGETVRYGTIHYEPQPKIVARKRTTLPK